MSLLRAIGARAQARAETLIARLNAVRTPPSGFVSIYQDALKGRLFVKKDSGTTVDLEIARILKSATTEVDVSAAAAPSSGQVLTATGSTTATWQAAGASGWPAGTYGQGTDGAADLDGTNTVAWASKSGAVYTMTRDAYLTSLTVRNGSTLVKAYIPYVTGTLTVESTGIVHADGNAASGATAGGQLGPSTRRPNSQGQSGAAGRSTTGAGANVGVNVTMGFGGSGGTGGASGLGQAGGAPGGFAALTADAGQIRTLGYALLGVLFSGTTVTRADGGSGAGAGGCNIGTGTATSGGGGGAAPISILFAKTIANSGTIRCTGGAGGNAAATGNGQAGGGAGGGGGFLLVITDTTSIGGTLTANGGAGGTGAGGGSAGDAGSAGTVWTVNP